MGKISVFNHISIDGFYAGPNGEIDWFKIMKPDKAFDTYTHKSAMASHTILMGRTTYDMMKSYWPTKEAMKADPEIARIMIESPKIVFSKKMKTVEEGPNWKNIRLFKTIDADELRKIKKKENITILGSGSIVQQFANLGLLDLIQLNTVPIILGKGKSLFKNVHTTNMKLVEAKSFKNGMAIHTYKPV